MAAAAAPSAGPLRNPIPGGVEAVEKAPARVPVEVRGDRVEYRGKENRVVFSGNVAVTRGTAVLKSDTLETTQGSLEATARGNVRLTDPVRKLDLTCTEVHYTHGLRHVAASGTCQLIAGEEAALTVVTSDAMEVMVERHEAVARGRVHIMQGTNEALCGEAHLFGNEDRLVLTGRPLLRHPPHEFESDEVVSYLREGRTVLKGNVSAILHTSRAEDLRRSGP